MGYKNSENRYPQNGLISAECILDMFQKISKMENVYLYIIAEFILLFVDIKHMRPVTEVPVADLTLQFYLIKKNRGRLMPVPRLFVLCKTII